MTVKELIAQLQKLPLDDEIVADVLSDEQPAEIICARSHVFVKGRSYIAVDRSWWLKERASDIEDMRDQLLEEPEDEDVW